MWFQFQSQPTYINIMDRKTKHNFIIHGIHLSPVYTLQVGTRLHLLVTIKCSDAK